MIGPTLGRYFGRRVLTSILAIFAIAFTIVFLFDFLDMVRANVDRPGFSWSRALAASLFRIPTFSEQVLPFATLFGAMAALLALSRRLELVVARAAGISVWQFMAPPVLVAVIIGVVSSTLYNPIAAALKERSDTLLLELSGGEKKTVFDGDREVWIRQDGKDGESIVHAMRAADRGLHLADVTVFSFLKTGRFHERIEATRADYDDGQWILTDARVQAVGVDPQHFDTLRIPTRLKREQVGDSLAEPETVSFWALPSFIETARNAGLPAFQFELQYQLLLARPLLLVAMVAIAATVSLRVFRFGNIGRMILGGVAAGFVLYVVGEVARGLGGAGMVPPFLAAWSPAVVASSMGFTILLYLEDG
ncbi:LPS export ABC transporter permease LptG [Siculibacillus lacustris]|uniref:LPS export ABC transporter permease LptG n=1 Tax=Siculibacillus lacustris TaxID=1549641 RepID=A0A4Q9VVI8_9HYPH|nr:LPS export ABC transporter permease LptG [Siculibacillus lacustris]TBW39770.1 LPS export ABC transporter permease LptG [Siculibacillus lacustris]